MGFNRKTDYQSGRTLDLDKSYRLLIEPAVQEAGLECIRADKIVHSGVTDVPMYRYLLDADLVIADLSTSNPNAIYELGVRHALRPYSTIVIAESKLQYPFNIAHTAIRSYEHLGDAIDYEEVVRFRGELKQAIAAIVAKQARDSPVYTFLPGLRPPSIAAGRGVARGATRSAAPGVSKSAATVLEQAAAALDREDFSTARAILADALAMKPADRPRTADDDYLVQQLAHTTMMAKPGMPSLVEAQRLLGALAPATSNDPERVELWGKIAVAMWDETHQAAHMEDAVAAYERTFCLRGDIESGATLAFLLNVRASICDPASAVADFVQARRVRRRVLPICESALETERSRAVAGPDGDGNDRVVARRFRLRVVLAETQLGLDNVAESKRWEKEALDCPVAQRLKNSAAERLATLTALLEQSPLRFLAV